MNILFYCSEYPPYIAGGIGTVTKIVAEELVKRGHEVAVIGYYPDMADKFEQSIINGVKVIRHNLGLRNSKVKERIFIFLRTIGLSGVITKRELKFIEDKIYKYIADFNVDVLELTDYYSFTLCRSRLTFKRFPIPTILRIHGSVSFIQNLSGRGRPEYVENDYGHFSRCDYISAVSQYSMSYVNDNFQFPATKEWRVIYNPIKDSFLNASTPQGGNSVLFIGKLTKTKGCDSLIKAFNNCAEEIPSLSLRFAGGGDIDRCLELVDNKFRDRVHFLGYCDRETLEHEIDTCSFACIPSYFENFSMVALEVMARSKALIYTNRTSGPELIEDGVDGFLVDPDDIDSIVEKIRLLSNDHVIRDRLAINGANTVKSRFTSSVIVNDLENFYEKVAYCK